MARHWSHSQTTNHYATFILWISFQDYFDPSIKGKFAYIDVTFFSLDTTLKLSYSIYVSFFYNPFPHPAHILRI